VPTSCRLNPGKVTDKSVCSPPPGVWEKLLNAERKLMVHLALEKMTRKYFKVEGLLSCF
jgi:hypothetical protein